jgi:hypothetical protein
LDRKDAVAEIVSAMNGQAHYLVTAPPGTITVLGESLGHLSTWRAYVDSGVPTVMSTNDASALFVTSLLMPMAAVIVVPKTVSPAELSEVLGRTVPEDGSQDIVILHEAEDAPIIWPMLFLEAMRVVDPDVVEQILAHQTTEFL